MLSEISLYKVYLEYAETVKDKHTGNDSGFITYSNTINIASKWLDNSDYLITLVKEKAITWFKKLGKIKKVIKVGKISEKYDTLTVEEKRIALIGNKTKKALRRLRGKES